ncbi:NAD-dependent epimerase/dehydratase family protein [Paenibacillus agricola]|uniref:NAD-dependent epimerase/dehydratase family protein n=1 Tax=Paenibacillus agricola TaxID=2716264 RepID=A0ABX0JE45_9BACL|nr:NAD-dependent epimerase/dehydratase family protein [Paenibacillus agricola]NHN34041.1 NAD-dependent epimerase/dehydratase family protein [Paenibacillus agricola]
MNVLILGGTGVISREIVAQLLSAGHEVVVFNRGTRKLPFSSDVEWIIGDKSDNQSFNEAVKKRTFDVVIDMISFNEADARSTVSTFNERAGQLIMCSSVAAYKRPYKSAPIKEDAEELFDNPEFAYAFQKAEMERYLQRNIGKGQLPVTIIRPSLTYGIGGSNLGVLRQNYNIVQRIRNNKPLLMFGDGTTPWGFTFAPDLAKAFVGAVGNKRTYNQAYHATNEDVHIWNNLYEEFGNIIGIEPQIVHISSELLVKANPSLFAHLVFEKSYSGLFDNSKIKRDIPGFEASISLNEGLRMMLNWYESEGSIVDPEKEQLENRLTDIYMEWSKQMEQFEA